MMASNPAGERKWWESPIHTAYNLYLFIIVLAVMAFSLGVQSIALTRDLGRGDPYHSVHWEVFDVVAGVFAVAAIGFSMYRGIRRLLLAAQDH